jgi:hypothetical protein
VPFPAGQAQVPAQAVVHAPYGAPVTYAKFPMTISLTDNFSKQTRNMEAIMQWIMKMCVRGALGLGAAALLLSGVPAQANPAAGGASRESQPRLLAQSKAQPGEAQKLEQQRLKEQQDQAKMQQEEQKQQSQPRMRKMRGAMPEAASPTPGKSRFGAGVIRQNEKPVDSE